MTEAPLVDLLLEDPRWEAAALGAIAERAARATLAALGRDPRGHEISLLGAHDARIAELNAAFRGKAAPTNVLSWPAFPDEVPAATEGEPVFLGDLALSFDTCLAEAEAAGLPLDHHVTHLVVHGVLHLLGHDHQEDAAAEAMETLEAKVLASLGVPNPYGR